MTKEEKYQLRELVKRLDEVLLHGAALMEVADVTRRLQEMAGTENASTPEPVGV